MASNGTFASGLNNWISSDKPARVDFVEDNRITDEHIMCRSNPHGVTALQAEAAPIGAFIAHKDNLNNPHVVTKGQLGLENVRNTEVICTYNETTTTDQGFVYLSAATGDYSFVCAVSADASLIDTSANIHTFLGAPSGGEYGWYVQITRHDGSPWANLPVKLKVLIAKG